MDRPPAVAAALHRPRHGLPCYGSPHDQASEGESLSLPSTAILPKTDAFACGAAGRAGGDLHGRARAGGRVPFRPAPWSGEHALHVHTHRALSERNRATRAIQWSDAVTVGLSAQLAANGLLLLLLGLHCFWFAMFVRMGLSNLNGAAAHDIGEDVRPPPITPSHNKNTHTHSPTHTARAAKSFCRAHPTGSRRLAAAGIRGRIRRG